MSELKRGTKQRGRCETMVDIWENLKRRPTVCLLLGIFLLAVLIPWYREGIMCNDELQSRFSSYQGFLVFFQDVWDEHIHTGRALSCLVNPLTRYPSFLGQALWSYKISQVASILLIVASFFVLLHRLFSSRSFCAFCALALIAFLPVSFELTSPNAFTTLYNIPFSCLLLSMILYWDWLKQHSRKKLIASLILLFIALCSYEAFVTFVPAYVALVVYQRGFRESLRRWKDFLWPVGTGVFFLALYFVIGKLIPSQYTGNRLILPDPLNAVKIVVQLIRSAFPGYYWTLPKYHYLWKLYQDITIDDIARLFLVCGAFSALVYALARRGVHDPHAKKQRVFSLSLCTLLLVVLPAIPTAMAELYQTTLGGNNGSAVPTSFFMYFPATFLCCFVFWQALKRLPKKAAPWVAISCMLCVMIPVQLMNGEFAERHEENFHRLETMEAAVKSPYLQNAGIVHAPDFYETRDAMGFHDGYWTQYAAASGNAVQLVKEEGAGPDQRIYFNDSQFNLWAGDALCVLSTQLLSGFDAVQYLSDVFLTADYSAAFWDGTWYVCYFTYNNGTLVPSTAEVFAAEQARLSVGQTLTNSVKVSGYYNDGWVAPESTFLIRSGETGQIKVSAYYPQALTNTESVTCFVDGQEVGVYALTSDITNFSVPCSPDTTIELRLQCNFTVATTGGDIRELSFVLSALEGI